ncbi:27544_t:CDS:2 [Gigaspora margarita]|uniref:27544_t:CDS:1 n=1 Tax=Gigaspora margarita TaxID=4874 RepID=A0ABN7UB92_GIGMA|nr:27544_t:CDS:2 [Gigaspora margarita]
MALGKIFRKERKTEPMSVFLLRIIVTTLFIFILVGYSVFLILDVCNDHPAIQSSFIEVNSFPVPELMFLDIPVKTYFDCYFTYAANNTREDNKACTQYLKQPVLNATSKYNGYFQTGGGLLFSANSNSSNEVLKNIGIMIYIDDSTYNASDPSMFVNMRAVDSELYKTYGSKLFGGQNSMFLDSIVKINTYELSPNQSYNVQLTRNIKQLMSQSWKNYFGFAPETERIPYVTSTIGTGAIKPWGLVQRHLFKVNQIVQDKLLSTLESMPFISHLTHNSDDLKEDLSTEKLEKRLDLLQLFLRDYVVNVQYLENIQQSDTMSNEELEL